MRTKKIYVGLFLAILALAVIGVGYLQYSNNQKVSADVTPPKIYVQTSKTSFVLGEQVTASIVVDGGGQSFTSFKAAVALNNLTVDGNLTLGSSVTNWQKQPSPSSLDFLGGVQGSATNVVVYSMTLKAVAAGSASISISGGSIYQVQADGMTISDIIGSSFGSSYTVTAPETPATEDGGTTTNNTNTTPTTITPKTTTKTVTKPKTATSTTATTETAPVTTTETPPVVETIPEAVKTSKTTASITGQLVEMDRFFLNVYTVRDKVVLKGKADPESDLIVYIYSEPIQKRVKTDVEGNWSITVDPLEAGSHRVEVTYADSPDLTPKVVTTFEVVGIPYYYLAGGLLMIIAIVIILLIMFNKKHNKKEMLSGNPVVPVAPAAEINHIQAEVIKNDEILQNQQFIVPVPKTENTAPANSQTTAVPTIQTPQTPIDQKIETATPQTPVSPGLVTANPSIQSTQSTSSQVANPMAQSNNNSSVNSPQKLDSISGNYSDLTTQKNDQNT
jgi:hypothetical protein